MKKLYLLIIGLFIIIELITRAQVIDSTTILFNIDTVGKKSWLSLGNYLWT